MTDRLTNLDALLFLVVLALPNDSSRGLETINWFFTLVVSMCGDSVVMYCVRYLEAMVLPDPLTPVTKH